MQIRSGDFLRPLNRKKPLQKDGTTFSNSHPTLLPLNKSSRQQRKIRVRTL